jgi:hypothetical protein
MGVRFFYNILFCFLAFIKLLLPNTPVIEESLSLIHPNHYI